MDRILAVYPNITEHSFLADAFSDSGYEIVCTSSIIEAVKILVEQTFSLIFVDSKMLIGGKDDVITTLKTISSVPVVVVNAVVTYKNASNTGLHAKSDCTPSSSPEKNLDYQRILTFDRLIIDPNRREVLLDGTDLCFTKIEFDILYFLACHKGRVVSRDQIYANVWTYDTSFDVDELVKAHIKRMRKKFPHTPHQYIQNIRGVGYKFCD